LPKCRYTAENKTNEKKHRGERITRKKEFNNERKSEQSKYHADTIWQERDNAFLKMAEEPGYRVDDFIVDTHGNGESSAADTGDNVGNADSTAAKNIKKKFHS